MTEAPGPGLPRQLPTCGVCPAGPREPVADWPLCTASNNQTRWQGAAHWRTGGLGSGSSWESPLAHARAPSPALSWPHVAGCLPHPECTALSLALCLPSRLARGLAQGPNAGLSPRLSVVSGPCPHRLFQHLLPTLPVQEGPPGPQSRPCWVPGWPRPLTALPLPRLCLTVW